MPIYRQDGAGRFVPFETIAFPEIGKEQLLEDWIEQNPHLVLEGEKLAIIGRQPRTGFDKWIDLLAVDETGACVVIELKRGETPREVIAQALEYASWVDSLTADDLDDIASNYGQQQGLEAASVADVYDSVFADGVDEPGDRPSDRVTFNTRQRIVIVAERIADEVEQTLRYLRQRFGADVYGVEFSVHRAGDEMIVVTTTVVGRERVKPQQAGTTRNIEAHDATKARVRTQFLREAVDEIEEWFRARGFEVAHTRGSDHAVRHGGRKIIGFYFGSEHIYFAVAGSAGSEVDELRRLLSRPSEVIANDSRWRFHVCTREDWETARRVLDAWLPQADESAGRVVVSG